jgi:hypothetical protein
MLTSVNLNYQPSLPINEIYNVWSNRLLPYEFQPKERSRVEVLPQQFFGRGRIPTKTSCYAPFRYVCATHPTKPPYPDPLPAQRGEGELRPQWQDRDHH